MWQLVRSRYFLSELDQIVAWAVDCKKLTNICQLAEYFFPHVRSAYQREFARTVRQKLTARVSHGMQCWKYSLRPADSYKCIYAENTSFLFNIPSCATVLSYDLHASVKSSPEIVQAFSTVVQNRLICKLRGDLAFFIETRNYLPLASSYKKKENANNFSIQRELKYKDKMKEMNKKNCKNWVAQFLPIPTACA